MSKWFFLKTSKRDSIISLSSLTLWPFKPRFIVPHSHPHFQKVSQFSRVGKPKMRSLAVFDFDHTILNDNSDTAILELVNKEEIPIQIRQLQCTEGWTSFMQGVFRYLYERGVSAEEIKTKIKSLAPVAGMMDLIQGLKDTSTCDLIIISDSNSIFITTWLESQNIDKCFLRVFTNPAEVVDGVFQITPFHVQETCKLSTKNLCKGQVFDQFVEKQQEQGIIYDKVLYIGDGVNDFCPVVHLRMTDLAFARNNYKLLELINKARRGQMLDNSGKPHLVKAEVFTWENGNDIRHHLNLMKS